MVFFTSSKCYNHKIILSSNDGQLLKSCRSLKIKFLDPVGSLVSTLWVGCCWLVVTLFQNLFILSVVVL